MYTITDYYVGCIVDSFTVILAMDTLNLSSLYQAYLATTNRFSDMTFAFQYVHHEIGSYLQERKRAVSYMSYMISITVVQQDGTFLIVDADHYKVDGTLLFHILSYWASQYHGPSIPSLVLPMYTGNYPLSKKKLQTLKQVYPFSDYVLMTTIWSYYLASTKKVFGHIVSKRNENETYEIGNYITIVPVELHPDFKTSCSSLQQTLHSVKSKTLTRQQLFTRMVTNYVKSDIVFDSWTMFKHLSFSKQPRGIYRDHLNPCKVNGLDYVVVIGMHDDTYYLTHAIPGCSQDSFSTWMSTNKILN